MPSFGEKLKLEREKRKITLDQISSSTKIGTRMLQALEEEKFSQLPGGIFNKGFVRAYARVVGLDEDQTVADYLLASGDATAARPELATRENSGRDAASRDAARDEDNRISRLEAISDEPSRPLPWGLFAVLLLVIALLLSVWSYRRRAQERQDARPEKTAVQSRKTASPAATRPAEGSATSTSTPNTQVNSSSDATGTRGGSPAATPAEKASSPPGQNSSQSSPTSNGLFPAGHELQTAILTPSPGEFLVLIHAREESWVSVTVDGKSAGSELLESGSERTFHAHSQVSVKAGNAGAIDFQLDGKKLEVGGEYGEVKSITIGHAGLIPNPAQPPTNP